MPGSAATGPIELGGWLDHHRTISEIQNKVAKLRNQQMILERRLAYARRRAAKAGCDVRAMQLIHAMSLLRTRNPIPMQECYANLQRYMGWLATIAGGGKETLDPKWQPLDNPYRHRGGRPRNRTPGVKLGRPKGSRDVPKGEQVTLKLAQPKRRRGRPPKGEQVAANLRAAARQPMLPEVDG